MSTVVSELQRWAPDGAVETVARFVARAHGSAEIVGVHPRGADLAAQLVAEGITTTDGRRLFLADGAAFVAALAGAVSGSRLWATPAAEVDEPAG